MPTVGSWCEFDVMCSAITALIQWTRPCVGFCDCTPPTGIVPINAAWNSRCKKKEANKWDIPLNMYSIWLSHFFCLLCIQTIGTHDSLLLLTSSQLELNCCRFLFALYYRYAVADSLYDYCHCLRNCYCCLSPCCYCWDCLNYFPMHSKGMMGLLTSTAHRQSERKRKIK